MGIPYLWQINIKMWWYHYVVNPPYILAFYYFSYLFSEISKFGIQNIYYHMLKIGCCADFVLTLTLTSLVVGVLVVAVVTCCELKLWVDIDIHFTINFYIAYILYYYNLIKLHIIYFSFLLCSSCDVLARDLRWWFQAWRKISLDILLHIICVAYLKIVC